MWLPIPWGVRPMRRGLGGNKEFEGAAIAARIESSKWAEMLVEGKLGRNNGGATPSAAALQRKQHHTVPRLLRSYAQARSLQRDSLLCLYSCSLA